MGPRGRTFIFILLLVTVLAVLTGQVRGQDRRSIGPIGTGILAVLGPVHTTMARSADAVTRLWMLYTEIGILRAENTRLRTEIEGLNQEVSRLRETAAAAQRLERLLAFRAQLPYKVLSGRVVGRDPQGWFSTILVDRGSLEGVVRNAAVVTADGVVGRVIEVTPFNARVLLLSDNRSAVSVLLQDSREVGVLEGTGAGRLHLKYLSRLSPIHPGERVVTSGQGGVFPRGILVGTVRAVREAPAGVFREGTVQPAADLARLEEVLILLPEPQ